MKSKIIMSIFAMAVSAPAFSGYSGGFHAGFTPEQYQEMADLAVLDEAVEIAKTDPAWAGLLFEAKYKGEVYKVVDRRNEPKQQPQGNTDRMQRFINGLNAEARSQIQVQVIFYPDGTESWTLSFNANLSLGSGMKDAMGKYHK